MNILNSIGPFMKRLRSSASPDPVRDWLVLLTVSIIALAGIIVWNVWAFDTVANGGIIGKPAAKAPAAFNNSSLDTIHAVFSSRVEKEEKYITGAYRFIDPSQ